MRSTSTWCWAGNAERSQIPGDFGMERSLSGDRPGGCLRTPAPGIATHNAWRRAVNHIKSKYSVLRLLSTLGGLGLVGVAAFLNVHHAAESEGSIFSPVCIAIVALAFGSALAVPVMLALWRSGRRGLALVALAGLVASESYGFQLSAERLLSARAQRAQQTKTAGSPYALA